MAQENRENWTTWYEFIFSCIGVTVGLGNVWRFPYICFKNGGGAFLVPYVLLLLLWCVPQVLLQFSYGQFSNMGPGKIWVCCPLFEGIGYSMMLMVSFCGFYYSTIIAWILYYFGMSFFSPIPWDSCSNPWNTDKCYTRISTETCVGNCSVNATSLQQISTSLPATLLNDTIKRRTSTEEFWERYVLELTSDITEQGTIRWQLFLCLLATTFVICLSLFKGIKSSGKVMYFAATCPFVILLVLFVRGLTLPGSLQGLKYFFVPRFEELLKFQVWIDAANQVIFSIGLAAGELVSLSSYNNFHNNCYRDAIIVPMVDLFSSVLSGATIFLTLGYMADKSGLPIKDIVDEGPGIAFMVFPEALATLPVPQLWSALFFFMLFLVGLDTQIVGLQLFAGSLVDRFPHIFGSKKTLTFIGWAVCSFLIGIPFVTQGGMYLLQLVDWYLSSLVLLFICGMEVTVLAWVYGADNIYENIEMMIGYKPNAYWKIAWKYIIPVITWGFWLVSIVTHESVTYGGKAYPGWSIVIGWVMAVIVLCPIPIFIVLTLRRHTGTFIQRLKKGIQPTDEWQPAIKNTKDEKMKEHFLHPQKDTLL